MSKLLEQREKMNLTQEALAKRAGVSVRTIQRIESGISPKGYTLKSLAKALNISEEALLASKENSVQPALNLVLLINLSSLFVAFIPIVNFALPLSIALFKKQLHSITKQIITIQLLWTCIFVITYFLSLLLNLEELGRSIAMGILLFLVCVNVYIILRNSIELRKNNKLHIYFKFPIL